jgi:hypothetical protein
MTSKPEKLLSSRIGVTIFITLIVFLSAYFFGGFYDAFTRYSNAVLLAERHAHTVIGKEGYEYIFEPSTWVLIDKIKPNKGEIIFYVFLEDYLPLRIGSECTFPDQDVCNWMNIHILYGHDPESVIRKTALYALIIALLVAFINQLVKKVKFL